MAAYRPTDWHVLDLDKDPVPGDPQRVKKLAASLHDFADDVAQVLRDIKGMAGEDAILSWAGKTADSFTEEFQEAPGKLKKLKKSYNLAGDALASYWPDLESAQDQADKALRDARTARADLAAAHTALGTATEGVRTADAKADSYDPAKNHGRDVPKPDEAEVRRATRNATHAHERQQAAQGRVNDAQSALDAAKRLAEQARGLRQEAARRTVKKIEDASDAGIPNRHWWEEAVDWVADHWDEIVTVCKWVVTIVGLIVMIVGGPLGWLVFAAALVVMADTIRKVINGEAGWSDLIWAALDCVPATKGFTSLAKLGKLWKAGGLRALGGGALKGIGGGLKNTANSLRSIGNRVSYEGGRFLHGLRAAANAPAPGLVPAGPGVFAMAGGGGMGVVSRVAAFQSGTASYVKEIKLTAKRWPESAQHIDEAQNGTIWRGRVSQAGPAKPDVLTIDRALADDHRADSLRGIAARGADDLDRDEYPPAMFREGGTGASVKYVRSGDNSGAGSSMGNRLRGLPDGARVKITPTDLPGMP